MKVIFFLAGNTHLVVTSEKDVASNATQTTIGSFTARKGKSNDVELQRADCRMEKQFDQYNWNDLPSPAALRSAFGGNSTRRDVMVAQFNKASQAIKQKLHLEDFAASIGATSFIVA